MGAFYLDDTYDEKAVAMAISALQDGNTRILSMYTDAYVRQFASNEDFDFWIAEKKRLNAAVTTAQPD